MKVAFVTPELYPFSKTGGLGDVSQALSQALVQNGVQVQVFTPFYSSALRQCEQLGLEWRETVLPEMMWVGDEPHPVAFRTVEFNGVEIVFLCNSVFYERPHPYLDEAGQDYTDNVSRFAFFCRAVLAYYAEQGTAPDVFHVHDWQTALIPVYLRSSYAEQACRKSASLLTIHNLGYQGLFPAPQIYATGLDWDYFTPESLEFFGSLNLLKGGVYFADAVNAVSPTYAKEIQTDAYGAGLDGVMVAHKRKLSGILNGVDTQIWNPATDPCLPANYSARSLSGKTKCKRELQREFSLPTRPDTLLYAVVSRFDRQKGIELICGAWPSLSTLDAQLVLLGTGSEELEQAVRKLAQDYPQQVSANIGYDERLAHLIEAGADAFLMPSAYEPGGLNQLYSHLYGTVPVVRETGGLKDTVVNATAKNLADGSASGFTFRDFAAVKLADAMRRAARLFHTDRKAWRAMMKHMMLLDHSWSRSAQAYIQLYEKLAAAKHTATGGAAHGG